MPLGIGAGLSPGDFVLDWDPASLPKCLVSAQNSHTVHMPIQRTKTIVPLLITL